MTYERPAPQTPPPPVALTVAGSDSSGGAGLQADLKTFEHFGVFGCSAITLVTAQNTAGVTALSMLATDLVAAQLRAVSDDFALAAVKFGALGNADVMRTVVDWRLSTPGNAPLIIDPVMVSKHGHPLLDPDAIATMREAVLPLATVITPNRHEAALLWERSINSTQNARHAADELSDRFECVVVITAGSFDGESATDIIAGVPGLERVVRPRLRTRHVHGSGCTFAAAIAAGMARGADVREAIEEAKAYVTRAIKTGPAIGSGVRPLNHRGG